jgi:hypothetical protein
MASVRHSVTCTITISLKLGRPICLFPNPTVVREGFICSKRVILSPEDFSADQQRERSMYIPRFSEPCSAQKITPLAVHSARKANGSCAVLGRNVASHRYKFKRLSSLVTLVNAKDTVQHGLTLATSLCRLEAGITGAMIPVSGSLGFADVPTLRLSLLCLSSHVKRDRKCQTTGSTSDKASDKGRTVTELRARLHRVWTRKLE